MKRFSSFKEMLDYSEKNSTIFRYVEGKEIRNISYGEFVELVNNFPIPNENVIGILADINIESITAIFALASKKQIVLLNPNDSIEVLRKQIKATNVARLIGDEDLIEEIEADFDIDESINTKDILFFTSGTTSSSKAVVLDEQKLCNAAYNGGYCLPLSKEDVLFESALPLSHVFGFVCALLWPISFGACVALPRGITSLFEDINILKPTCATLVPQIAAFLAMKKLFNPEMKMVLIGAGDCPDSVLSLINSLGIRVSFGYGLTETSSGIALSLGDNPRAMTICPDYQVELAEDGEIIVSSQTTLMKGYYKDPKSTDETIIDGKLHTGDLGSIIEGKLFIVGRKKDIIVCNDGTKIFVPEYENNLAKALYPENDFAIIQDDHLRIVLYIYTNNDVQKQVDAFNDNLPRGNRISRIVYAKEKLPRTKTNKVKKYMIKF